MKNCNSLQISPNEGVNSLNYRDRRIDSVKFCLILLVIIGHVFSNEAFRESYACEVIWKWIYMFHMPLFVFISGFFSHKKKQFNGFMKGIIKILEPLIIIQMLFLIMDVFLTKTISINRILTPWWVMWYLLSLIYWRTMLYILPQKVLEHKKLIITVSFIIGIVAGFLPFNRFLSLQRTLAFLPFFLGGYCMQGKQLYLPSKFKPLCIVVLCLAFIVPIYFPYLLGDLRFADKYIDISYMFSRIFVYFMSIVMSISFICVCPNIMFFSKQGKYTLQYYVYHALILFVLFIIINKFNLPKSTFTACTYSFFVLSCIWLFSYSSYFTKFTNPSSFLRER